MRIRISQFSGEAPRLSPFALPEQMAAEATNCRFESGAIQPLYGLTSVATLTLIGNVVKDVVTAAPQILPRVAMYEVNGSAGSAGRGIRLKTAGVRRWDFRLDSTAESGSNTGANIQLARADDAGSILGTVLSVSRATGQVSMTDAGVTLAGTYNKPLTLGSNNLWVDGSGKLRIKSGTPSSDTDGTVVGTQS